MRKFSGQGSGVSDKPALRLSGRAFFFGREGAVFGAFAKAGRLFSGGSFLRDHAFGLSAGLCKPALVWISGGESGYFFFTGIRPKRNAVERSLFFSSAFILSSGLAFFFFSHRADEPEILGKEKEE